MKRLLATTVKHMSSDIYLHLADHSEYAVNYGTFLVLLKNVLVDGWGGFPVTAIRFEEDYDNPEEYWLCHIYTEAKAKDLLTVIELKGTSYPYLNKEHRVQFCDIGKLTIAIPKEDSLEKPEDLEQLSDVFLSYPPLGWEVRYEKSDALVLGSTDPEYYNFFLRFQDKIHPTLGPHAVKQCIVSAYTHMDGVDDIKHRRDRLKMPFISDIPEAPEVGFDGETSGSEGKFGFSSLIYGLYLKLTGSSFEIETTNVGTILHRDFDLIGDNKTFYFGFSPSSVVFTPHMFGVYTPHNETTNPYPYLLGSRKKTFRSSDTLTNALGVNKYTGGLARVSDRGYTLERNTNLGGTLFNHVNPIRSSPSLGYYKNVTGVIDYYFDAHYFLFNRNSSIAYSDLGLQNSSVIGDNASGCNYKFSLNENNTITLSEVELYSTKQENFLEALRVEGRIRGMRHIVESTVKKPWYFNVYKDGRFFGCIPYNKVMSDSNSILSQSLNLTSLANGNIAFALDTWDE